MPHLSTYQRNRLLLTLASFIACLLFWFAGKWFGIPQHAHREISLAIQPTPVVDLLLTGIVLCVATGVGTAIAGSIRFDAGLFAGAVGLAALSCRGGPMRYVTQASAGRGVFLEMALELLVLGGLVGAAWAGLVLLHRRGSLLGDEMRDGLKDRFHAMGERFLALATQAATTAVIVLILARVDDKKQVLAAVGIASFVATLFAYAVSPVRPSVWYWAGPVVVGCLGYLAASVSSSSTDPVVWKSGSGSGIFAPLARPLPLDYASVGTAAAIAAYWTSRQWQRAKELEREAQEAAAGPEPYAG